MIARKAELFGRCPQCGRWVALHRAETRDGRGAGVVRAHGWSKPWNRPQFKDHYLCPGVGQYPTVIEPADEARLRRR